MNRFALLTAALSVLALGVAVAAPKEGKVCTAGTPKPYVNPLTVSYLAEGEMGNGGFFNQKCVYSLRKANACTTVAASACESTSASACSAKDKAACSTATACAAGGEMGNSGFFRVTKASYKKASATGASACCASKK